MLVTGASSGIGLACVHDLAQAGCTVFAGVRRAEDGERAARLFPGRVQWLLLDVTRADQIAAAADRVGDIVGEAGLAGLVNNAGIALGGPLEYITTEVLRRQFEINVVGPHAVTRALLPAIRRARGRIVQIGSIAGRVVSPLLGPYSASKHALEALSDALRMELAPDGIQVAVIEPGLVRTPIWEKGLATSDQMMERIPPEGRQRYGGRLRVFRRIVERAPGRAIPPERVAEAVRHALLAPEPRTRYVLGLDARIRLWLAALLSDRMMDALVLGFMSRLERRLR